MAQNGRHVCGLKPQNGTPAGNFRERIRSAIRRATLISRLHPNTLKYFFSDARIRSERHRHLTSGNRATIHPFSFFRLCWCMAMMAVYSAIMLAYPMYVAFHNKYQRASGEVGFALVVVDFACMLDVAVNCLTGRFSEKTKEVVLDRKSIVASYLRGYFVVDLVGTIPFKYVLNTCTAGMKCYFLHFVFLIKLLRLKTLLEYMNLLFHLLRIGKNVGRIVMYVLLSMLVMHWFACLNYAIPAALYHYRGYWHSGSWVSRSNLTDSPPSLIYRHCIFRATANFLGTCNSVDIPITYEDLALESLTFLFGGVSYIWIFIIIMDILIAFSANKTKYREIENQLREYMSLNGLPMKMQNRMLLYYKYRFQNAYFREDLVMEMLSHRLNREVKAHVCRWTVDSAPVFRDLDAKVRSDLVATLRIELYLPGDVIIKAGAVGECMYFLASGTVSVSTPTGKEVCHLEDGAFFGEIALLKEDRRRAATVTAIEMCEVFRLDRSRFLRCFPEDGEELVELKEIAWERYAKTVRIESLHKGSFGL